MGRVVDEGGAGVEGALVGITLDKRNREVRTDKGGAFQFEDTPTGHYTIWARAEGFITRHSLPLVIPEGGLHGYELQMIVSGRIQGQVPKPMLRPGMMVAVHHHGQEQVAQWVNVTDEGSFRIGDLIGGKYRLRLTAMPLGFQNWSRLGGNGYIEYWRGRDLRQEPDPPALDIPKMHKLFADCGIHMDVEVALGATTRVAFPSQDGSSVRAWGKLLDSRNLPGRSSLIFHTLEGTPTAHSAWIKPNGSFEVDLPRQGQYRVHWMRDSILKHCASWNVEVFADSKEEKASYLVLSAPKSELHIQLLDDKGIAIPLGDDPFASYPVLKEPGSRLRIPFPEKTVEGIVIFRELPPGEYVICGAAHETVPKADRNWKSIFGMPLWAIADPVHVSLKGEKSVVTVNMVPGAWVEGQVLDPNERLKAVGATAFFVRVWGDPKRGKLLHSTYLDRERFQGYWSIQFNGLPRGELFFSVEPAGDLASGSKPFKIPVIPATVTGTWSNVRLVIP